MSLAPYQLWVDVAPISSAIRVSSTVTITTSSAHGLQTGAYIQAGDLNGAAGTSMNGVYQITKTSGTTFTYSQAGSAGTATSGSAVISYDLLGPLDNYASGTARQYAANADISSLNLVANGDGSGASMDASILQEVTPSDGPFLGLLPDQARIRFAYATTGTTPSTTDVLFLGYMSGYTSQLNGSGQGSTSQLNVNDVNSLLDKVMVFGKPGGVVNVEMGGISRSSNVVTATTKSAHGFVTGQTITVEGVPGGLGTSFNGVFTVASTPSVTSLTWSQTGAAATGATAQRYALSRDGKSTTSVIFTAFSTDNANVVAGDGVVLIQGSTRAVNSWSGNPLAAIFGGSTGNTRSYKKSQIQVISSSSFRVLLEGAIRPGGGSPAPTFSGNALVYQSFGKIYDGANTNGQTSVIIKGNTSETNAVKTLLSQVNSYHRADYPLLRMLNTAGTAEIAGGTAYTPAAAFYMSSATLRSGLDSLVETYQSDARLRRYYVNTQGNLSYKLVDADAVPTYATAPYKIVTTGAGTPNTTTGAATVAASSLTVTYDHDTTKRAQFNVPAESGGGAAINSVLSYLDVNAYNGGTTDSGTVIAAYTARAGAPITEGIVDFPNANASLIPVAAAAWFKEQHQPLLSGQFELRGAGTAAHNSIGFFKGYYQTGASTYALGAWSPGQFVEITAAGLNLSGKYRVEQVSLSFEPASYNQVIGVTFNRKNPADLATIIASQRRA
jgi:hypothetical protein